MCNQVRALALGGILVLSALRSGAAAVPSDTSGLQFLGFQAGARLDDLDARLRQLGGRGLSCRRSKVDPRVTECRATLRQPSDAPRVDLWISAIDSLAGVITISGMLGQDQLDTWRRDLQNHYGTVGPKIQGPQWMLQWVRRGRMLRLTWRLDRPGRAVSVSLVDGRVLDDWARSSRSAPALRRTHGRETSS
jgi:hypothetical protein